MARRCLLVLILSLVARVAAAQPAEAPAPPPEPAPPAPEVVPPPSGPCGSIVEDFTVVCSQQRVAPSSAGELYADFVALHDRGGFTIGARVLSTLSTEMRRESVELNVGTVRDRGFAYRVLVRATRADLHDGGIDSGVEAGLQLLRMSRRWHVGIEGNGVFGIQFGLDNYALGAALLGEYELLATDRFAISALVRGGLDFFTAMDRSGEEDRFGLYISAALGVAWFTKGPQ